MVEYVDHLVGRIEKHLDSLGILGDTYLIFTGDNGTDPPVVSQFKGENYPGKKGTMLNAGTHVPLIISRPGTVVKQISDQLIDFSDFTPTFIDMAGSSIPTATGLDGRSFLPQLVGKENPAKRDFAYVWYNRNMQVGKTKVFARNQRYKLYGDGTFFDIKNDLWEENPLSTISNEQKMVRDKLQGHIDHYKQFEDSSRLK